MSFLKDSREEALCLDPLGRHLSRSGQSKTPHSPEQNGLVEQVIHTLKEQCVHWHRCASLQHASRLIGDWIHFYNHRRPHQALNMRTPAEAFASAA